MNNSIIYYARPNGRHYHTRIDCTMLDSGQFEKLKYTQVSMKNIKRRKLIPCACTTRFLIKKEQ